jgi:hypothetical protein
MSSEPKKFYERPSYGNVFGWLDAVRARPGMYIGDGSLAELETLIGGYMTALHVHHLDEGVPQMGSHFRAWLRLHTGWSMSCGWAHALREHVPQEEQLARFFAFVDEYRRLRPVILCRAILKEHHQPTGNRSVVGFGLLTPPPLRIEIVQYDPEPLHFLRSHYPDGVEDDHILLTASGAEATTRDDAKRWALDEFQIESSEWEDISMPYLHGG